MTIQMEFGIVSQELGIFISSSMYPLYRYRYTAVGNPVSQEIIKFDGYL